VCAGVATASTWEQWEKLMMTKRAFGGILVGYIQYAVCSNIGLHCNSLDKEKTAELGLRKLV